MSLLAKYEQRFRALQPREKQLLLLVAVLVPLLVGFFLFIDPDLQAADKLTKQNQATQRQINDMQTQVQEIKHRLNDDPNLPVRQRLQGLNEQINGVRQELAAHTTALVDARQMPAMLRQLLAATDKVELVSLTSLAPIKIDINEQPQPSGTAQTPATQNQSQATGMALYQHGVRLVLRGRYFDVQTYLQQVRNLDWHIYWHRFDYQADDYPQGQVSLELYTISTNASFMGL
ncbi:type II secretion system protein GspM [Bowmanella sp. JS7-9]|uniref:Type II secretion system protein GspM n=1 Tax=Pseudobowmanella zhangzhouensis TaxID=1537679 RepID=A0ABW1XM09_9ALTE|nr:type II secretion system protein GspM [Bowmanella sp. JS7-9]TBX21787.1 hypothetical protein TK45_09735 [Bowmanella sp. JS7-9]